MTRTELAYARQLHADTNAVIDALRDKKIAGPVNWGDLRCRAVRRVEECWGTKDEFVTSWEVLIEEASPTASEFQTAVSSGLVAMGYVGINVTTEW